MWEAEAPRSGVHPSDEITLDAGEGDLAVLIVPLLRAALDPEQNLVAGESEPGESLTLNMLNDAGGITVTRELMVDEDGRFEHDLSGTIDVRPGTRGTVTLTGADGHTYRADIRAVSAMVTIGWNELEARGTPGTTVGVTLSGLAGRTDSSGPSVVGADGFGSGDTLDTVDRAIITVRDPIVAGDRITLTQSGTLLPDAHLEVTLPDVTVAIDANRRRLRGTAPAGGPVEVTLISPGGLSYASDGVSTSDGRFDIAVPEAPIGPGWRAEAVWDGGNGLRVRAVGVVKRVSVGLHTMRIAGISRPLSDVSIVLHKASGERVGPWRTPTDREGLFTVLLLGRDAGRTVEHRIQPGDVVELDFADGDPVPINVPSLTARTDADGEAIVGEAPPGASVSARVPDGAADPSSIEVLGVADAAGDFRIELAGLVDIEPPLMGTVALVRNDGHEIEVGWASASIEAELFGSRISGNAAPERNVSLEVHDADGLLLTAAKTRAVIPAGDSVRWSIALTDSLGSPLRLTPGDVITALVGDERETLTLPRLEGVIHVVDDLVAGRTAPNTSVTIEVTRAPGGDGGGGSRTVTSDATGTFAHDFAGVVDIQYNDRIDLVAAVQRHRARRGVSAPGLRLNASAATLTGSPRTRYHRHHRSHPRRCPSRPCNDTNRRRSDVHRLDQRQRWPAVSAESRRPDRRQRTWRWRRARDYASCPGAHDRAQCHGRASPRDCRGWRRDRACARPCVRRGRRPSIARDRLGRDVGCWRSRPPEHTGRKPCNCASSPAIGSHRGQGKDLAHLERLSRPRHGVRPGRPALEPIAQSDSRRRGRDRNGFNDREWRWDVRGTPQRRRRTARHDRGRG